MATTQAASAQRLGRQSSLAFVGTVVTAVATFVLTTLVTNHLSESGAGAVFVGIAFYNIVMQFGLLGVASGQVRFVSRLRVNGRFGDVGQLLRTALVPVLLFAGLLAAATWAFAPDIAELLTKQSAKADLETLTGVLKVDAALLPMGVVALALMAATRGFGVIRPTVLYNRIGRSFVQLGAMGVVIALEGGPKAVMVAWMAPYALPVVAGIASVVRQLGRFGSEAPAIGGEPVAAGEFWRFALPQGGVEFFRALVRWQDTLLIAVLLGLKEAGIYTAVTSLVKIATMMNQAVVEVSAPQIAEAVAADDLASVRSVYQQASVWLVIAVFPVYLTTALFAEPLASIFGPGFTVGATALVILSIGRLVTTATGPVESVLVMSGRSGSNLAMHLTALVINVALNLLLVPSWGLEGAAVAWVASILVTNLGPYLQVARSIGVHPFSRQSLVAIPVTVLCFVVPAALVHFVLAPDPNLIWAAASTFVGGIVLLGWAWTQREELALDSLIPSRRPRR